MRTLGSGPRVFTGFTEASHEAPMGRGDRGTHPLPTRKPPPRSTHIPPRPLPRSRGTFPGARFRGHVSGVSPLPTHAPPAPLPSLTGAYAAWGGWLEPLRLHGCMTHARRVARPLNSSTLPTANQLACEAPEPIRTFDPMPIPYISRITITITHIISSYHIHPVLLQWPCSDQGGARWCGWWPVGRWPVVRLVVRQLHGVNRPPPSPTLRIPTPCLPPPASRPLASHPDRPAAVARREGARRPKRRRCHPSPSSP